MRHLISGEDCAIAGEATAATAAPVADTFKKSRRFIQASPYWGVSQISWSISSARRFALLPKVLWRGRFNTEVRPRKRNKGMTALIKRKSHGPWKRALEAGSRRGDNALELIANLGADRAVDRRVRAVRLALHDRRSRIGGDADRHVQRDLAQKRHRKPLRLMPRPAVPEDIRACAAMRALEVAHILDNAEDRHIDLLEHRKSPPRIDQGKVLR